MWVGVVIDVLGFVFDLLVGGNGGSLSLVDLFGVKFIMVIFGDF